MIDIAGNKNEEVVRVYLFPDANCLLAVAELAFVETDTAPTRKPSASDPGPRRPKAHPEPPYSGHMCSRAKSMVARCWAVRTG